jgi:MFS family permease
VLKRLLSKPAFLHIAFGSSLSSFAGYAIAQFAIPFLLRGYHLSLMQAAGAFALIGGIAAAIGVGSGGFLTDWAARRDPRLYVLIPAVAFLIAAPFYMAAFLQRDLLMLAVLIVFPAVLQYLYIGPTFGLAQNMVEPKMRATTAAILTLIINLIGYGLGPVAIGWASDQYAAQAFAGVDSYALACPHGLPPLGAQATQAALCRTASFVGLQRALVTASAVYAWAGLHFWLAARTLRRDLEA